MTEKLLILASASARRQELLRTVIPKFEVFPCALAEPREKPVGVSPPAWAQALAYFKARTVADRFPGRWVLGADTVVVCAGQVLGKPHDVEDARRMLHLQAGRASTVITGVCLVRCAVAADVSSAVQAVAADPRVGRSSVAGGVPSAVRDGGVRRVFGGEVTRVWMRSDPIGIEAYLAGGDWQGKAGAYGIQEVGDRLIARVEGSFSNVVGLPVERVVRMLHGVWGATAQRATPHG